MRAGIGSFASPRLVVRFGAAMLLVWLALMGISPPISSVFFVIGVTALFAYPLLIGLSSNDRRWAEVKGLLKFSLTLLIVGSTLLCSASVAQLMHQSDLTVALFNSIGLTTFGLGLGAEFLSVLVSRTP